MSVHTASPNDIYEDANGNRWLVTSVCHEPTVSMQLIQPGSSDPVRQSGGVSGLMWSDFTKVLDAPKARSNHPPIFKANWP